MQPNISEKLLGLMFVQLLGKNTYKFNRRLKNNFSATAALANFQRKQHSSYLYFDAIFVRPLQIENDPT